MRRQSVMNKGNENTKRRNANEENLLQKEMVRFEKEHEKAMKRIFRGRQVAKEALSEIRKLRAASLLASRNIILNNQRLNPPSESGKPTHLIQGTEATDKIPEIKSPCPSKTIQNASRFGKLSKPLEIDVLPPKNNLRNRSQTLSQARSRGDFFDSENSVVADVARRAAISVFPGKKFGDRWKKPQDSIIKSKCGNHEEFLKRKRISSDLSILSRAQENSHRLTPPLAWIKLHDEVFKSDRLKFMFDSSVSLQQVQMGKSVSVDDTSATLFKRSSLKYPGPTPILHSNKLGITQDNAKLRETKTAATVVQTLISRHQRQKAISKTTE